MVQIVARLCVVFLSLGSARAAMAQVPPVKPVTAARESAPLTKVAVLELAALGLSNDVRKTLEMLLRNSVATIEGYFAVSAVDIQIAVQESRSRGTLTCEGGPDCALQMARLVDADVVVFGTISSIGEAFSFNLRAMDVRKGKEISRELANISGNRNVLIPKLRLAAYRLVAPDKIRGWLEIESSVPGVEIEVDGAVMGNTPLREPLSLPPGVHVVSARRPGFSEFRKEFTITPFEKIRFKLDLGKAEQTGPR